MNITKSNTFIIIKVLTSSQGACVAVAALMQYFLMAAFCWMLVEGIYLYLLVVKVYNIESKTTIYHVLSWCKLLHFSHLRYYLPDTPLILKATREISKTFYTPPSLPRHMQFNDFKISTIILTHLADDDDGKSSSFNTMLSSCKSVFPITMHVA